VQYRQGKPGRIFIAKVEHGDDLLNQLGQLAVKEKIASAVLFLIGALKKAGMVVGPREDVVPPDPVWRKFDDAHEVLGIGTLFNDSQGEPAIHLHASVGRGPESLTGCIREDAQAYLVVEVIIVEMLGSGALRTLDGITGMNMLGFGSPETTE